MERQQFLHQDNSASTVAETPIKLNVNGTVFHTTTQVLTSEKDTFFTVMLSGQFHTEMNDKQECVIEDRDPGLFAWVMKHLEKDEDLKRKISGLTIADQIVLKQEFEYYGFSHKVLNEYFVGDVVLKCRTRIKGLKEPQFVTFDNQSEKIWVTDCAEKVVNCYNMHGEKEESHVDNSRHRAIPRGIACDSRGRIVVCHDGYGNGGKRLLVMRDEEHDTYIQAQDRKQFNKPKGVAIDDKDNIYLADGTNGRVLVYSSDGMKQKEIGQYGFNDGDFNLAWGIATSTKDNWLYVSDLNLHCIHVFDLKSGRFKLTIGSNEDDEPTFMAPTGICVTDRGHLFVCNNGRNTVEVFHGYSGAHIKTIDFDFKRPMGICVSSDQRYIAVTECHDGDEKVGSVVVFDVTFCDFSNE